MNKIDPLYDNVVLRVTPQPAEQVSKGGIVIAGPKEPELVFAEVLAAGPGRVTEYGVSLGAGVKAGDIVILPPGAIYEVVLDGERYGLCRGHDIRGIVRV